MSKKVKHTRVSITMTETHVEGMSKLVEMGLYLNRGEFVLEAIRRLLGLYGIEPFMLRAQPEEPRLEHPPAAENQKESEEEASIS